MCKRRVSMFLSLRVPLLRRGVWNSYIGQIGEAISKVIFNRKATIPTELQVNKATGDTVDETNICKPWKLKELDFEEMVLSINYGTSSAETAFNLVDNCVSADHPDRNSKLARERLTKQHQPKTAPSYIQLKKDFANNKLLSSESRPDKWMSDLESIYTETNNVQLSGKL